MDSVVRALVVVLCLLGAVSPADAWRFSRRSTSRTEDAKAKEPSRSGIEVPPEVAQSPRYRQLTMRRGRIQAARSVAERRLKSDFTTAFIDLMRLDRFDLMLGLGQTLHVAKAEAGLGPRQSIAYKLADTGGRVVLLTTSGKLMVGDVDYRNFGKAPRPWHGIDGQILDLKAIRPLGPAEEREIGTARIYRQMTLHAELLRWGKPADLARRFRVLGPETR